MSIRILDFTIVIVLLLFSSILLFCVEWIKLKIFTKKKILNANLTGEFAKIAVKYQEYNKNNKFDKTPGIKKYVKKVERVVHNYSFDVFSIKVYAFGDKTSNITQGDIENRKKIINELTSTEISEENKSIFYEMNDLLERIYKIQHPIKYFIMTLKKNALLQILKTFVKMLRMLLQVCIIISKTFLRFPKKKVKKKSETHYKQNFKSINLNINDKECTVVCAA